MLRYICWCAQTASTERLSAWRTNGALPRLVGEGMVITPKEYRRMAEECFGWASEAQTKVRLCYVNLAQTWLDAASWRSKMFPITARRLRYL